MIRAQITLSEEEYRAATSEANRLGITLAELRRPSQRSMLPVCGFPPWMRYAGMIESGAPQSSQRIDKIVDGEKP